MTPTHNEGQHTMTPTELQAALHTFYNCDVDDFRATKDGDDGEIVDASEEFVAAVETIVRHVESETDQTPADGEPATIEWAIEHGGCNGGKAAWWLYPHPADASITNSLRLERGVVEIVDCDPGGAGIVCALCNATRGQVQALASVLGITLKEPPHVAT